MIRSLFAPAPWTAAPRGLKLFTAQTEVSSRWATACSVAPSRAFCSAASRTHRTLALSTNASALPLTTHCCAARTFFSSWKTASSTTNGVAAAPMETSTFSSAFTTTTAASDADAAAAAKSEIKQLRQQVVDLKEALDASQETVKQLLVLTCAQKSSTSSSAATPAAAPAASAPCGPCSGVKGARGACYVVRTSEELVDALRGRGSEHASRTILLDGKLFLLDLYGKVEVDQARVSIVGNHATVIGHIAVKGRGAVLTASNVFFLCPYDVELRQTKTEGTAHGVQGAAPATSTTINATGKKARENVANLHPVLSATAGAGLHLDRCVLSNGRDGVYLGMGSHCTLRHVRIVNCIRGLYEGVGCRTSMIDGCVFQANRYHMVLLGPGAAERAARLFRTAAPSEGSSPSSPPLTTAQAATFTASFSPDATAADVLAPDVTTTSVIALQQTKAQVVLQHNPITDIYEEGMVEGQRVDLAGADATAGLSDPLF